MKWRNLSNKLFDHKFICYEEKIFSFFLGSMKINPTIILEEIIEQMKIEDKQKNDIQQLQFNH